MGSYRGGLLMVLILVMMLFSGRERLVEASGSRGGWWLVVDLDDVNSRFTPHYHRNTSLLLWDMLRSFHPRYVTVSCGSTTTPATTTSTKTHVVSVCVEEEKQVAEQIVQGSMIGHVRWCGWKYYYDVMSSGGSVPVCWVGLPAVAEHGEYVGIRVSTHTRKELGDARGEKSWWPWGVTGKTGKNSHGIVESIDAEHGDEAWRVVGGGGSENLPFLL
jgi:hypothetical protein